MEGKANKIVIGKALEVTPQKFDDATVKGVEKRVLIGRKLGAQNFVMRLFTVVPGGYSPKHSHDWEHEVYIVSGTATVVTPDGDKIAEAGSFVYVPGNVVHQFRNDGTETLKFICVIPKYAGE
ncbi:MAG: cupin domain-containing protein [Kosmotoga sp.]|uniref:cupin domain-containing protein n=1 Tax=Kosmotoga sp. TaxID=1955248 RepID=UPI0025C3C0D0|nr:cupin domain-containing protein [Kosmotoga sp.]MCD6159234.1 cupin domain-containing protein [Kosmotoga sp.]